MAFAAHRFDTAVERESIRSGAAGMAEVASAAFERRMLIRHEQLIHGGGMRIMTGGAVGIAQVVALVGGFESLILIVAIEA